MKRILAITIFLLAFIGISSAETFTSLKTGNWIESTTWGKTGILDLKNNDRVNIGGHGVNSNHEVTRQGSLSVNNKVIIYIYASNTLVINGDLLVNQEFTINIEAGGTFFVNGNIIIQANNDNQRAQFIINGVGNVTGGLSGYGTVSGGGALYVAGPVEGTIENQGPINNPLPVELLSFTGKSTPAGVTLNWVTATETNNMGFEIQRMDAFSGQWDLIGWVDGNYNHNGILNYSFLDHSPLQGVNYYRMRQLDYDGAYEFLGPLAVVNDQSIDMAGFKVYKNAATWHIALQGHDPYQVEVYDLAGRSLYSGQAVNNLSFPAPGQAVVIRVFNNTNSPVSKVVI